MVQKWFANGSRWDHQGISKAKINEVAAEWQLARIHRRLLETKVAQRLPKWLPKWIQNPEKFEAKID